jgi:hypothetical protein
VDPLLASLSKGRFVHAALFVASAAFAAVMLQFAWREPLIAAALLGGILTLAASRWISRRRLQRLLRSGDVQMVLERLSLERIPHRETMAPLMTATAFAAYGWVAEARAAMQAAARGPAWEAALEHRLFLDTLLLTFEGDREGALDQAGRLERLPLPSGANTIKERTVLLRVSASALARAFAHQSRVGDREVLEQTSQSSPLVFWAMRYAAAVVAIDSGDEPGARKLIGEAPTWPEESTFRSFHREIAARVGLPS